MTSALHDGDTKIQAVDGTIQHNESRNAEPVVSAVAPVKSGLLEAPEWVANLSAADRMQLEAKLKRKIDVRLLPMVSQILRLLIAHCGKPQIRLCQCHHWRPAASFWA